MPQMQLPAPSDPAHLDSLGLKPGVATFALSDLGGKDLILQVFSMYCPICQKEAPSVNELFELLQSGNLGDRVKLLGIGAGNSELEVSVFRDRYSILFPLIPDPDYVLHKIFGAWEHRIFSSWPPPGTGTMSSGFPTWAPLAPPAIFSRGSGNFLKPSRQALRRG